MHVLAKQILKVLTIIVLSFNSFNTSFRRNILLKLAKICKKFAQIYFKKFRFHPPENSSKCQTIPFLMRNELQNPKKLLRRCCNQPFSSNIDFSIDFGGKTCMKKTLCHFQNHFPSSYRYNFLTNKATESRLHSDCREFETVSESRVVCSIQKS